MNQDLVCLVYYSNARRTFDGNALSLLLDSCRRHNSTCDVTGMLLFHDGNFIQALEGPRDSVLRVFERIEVDPSHGGILSLGPMIINQRYFPDWSMGVLAESLLSLAGREAVSEFLRCKTDATTTPSSIAWRLLNSFREGVMRAG